MIFESRETVGNNEKTFVSTSFPLCSPMFANVSLCVSDAFQVVPSLSNQLNGFFQLFKFFSEFSDVLESDVKEKLKLNNLQQDLENIGYCQETSENARKSTEIIRDTGKTQGHH